MTTLSITLFIFLITCIGSVAVAVIVTFYCSRRCFKRSLSRKQDPPHHVEAPVEAVYEKVGGSDDVAAYEIVDIDDKVDVKDNVAYATTNM